MPAGQDQSEKNLPHRKQGREKHPNRGSAANPCKVGPFTRNRAGLLREFVQKQKWAVSWIGAGRTMEVNLAIFPVHTWPANEWEVNQCAV
jgi:hypothetical protein